MTCAILVLPELIVAMLIPERYPACRGVDCDDENQIHHEDAGHHGNVSDDGDDKTLGLYVFRL